MSNMCCLFLLFLTRETNSRLFWSLKIFWSKSYPYNKAKLKRIKDFFTFHVRKQINIILTLFDTCLLLFLLIYCTADTKHSVQMKWDEGNHFRMLSEFSSVLTRQGIIFYLFYIILYLYIILFLNRPLFSSQPSFPRTDHNEPFWRH